ncbi:hypothetical protein DIPPA_09881 [Diplonema papillatum]|nr:hypothetical protein DIPPA_09881 [Diplonema papillatum]
MQAGASSRPAGFREDLLEMLSAVEDAERLCDGLKAALGRLLAAVGPNGSPDAKQPRTAGGAPQSIPAAVGACEKLFACLAELGGGGQTLRKRYEACMADDTDSCCICLDPLESEVAVFEGSGCAHEVHYACGSLLKERKCPLCRAYFAALRRKRPAGPRHEATAAAAAASYREESLAIGRQAAASHAAAGAAAAAVADTCRTCGSSRHYTTYCPSGTLGGGRSDASAQQRGRGSGRGRGMRDFRSQSTRYHPWL